MHGIAEQAPKNTIREVMGDQVIGGSDIKACGPPREGVQGAVVANR